MPGSPTHCHTHTSQHTSKTLAGEKPRARENRGEKDAHTQIEKHTQRHTSVQMSIHTLKWIQTHNKYTLHPGTTLSAI